MSFEFMKIKNKIYTFSLLLVAYCLSLIATPVAYAGFSCQPIYGGGQTCVLAETISVNKTVMNPMTSKMVEGLGINDPKYLADQLVTFQISITNTSNAVISHIDVKDTLPQFTIFNAGPGNFNASTNTLTFGIDNLNPNETRTVTMVGKITSIDKLPSSQMVTCVVNQVTVTANTGAMSQDNAQFCIEKKVPITTKGGFPVLSPIPVYTTPSTGPESLALFGLIPTAMAGWFLRKKSNFTNRKEQN